MSYKNSLPLFLPDIGFVEAIKVSTLHLVISISQDLNTYFPSKQAYFRYKEPWVWTTMSPKNKSSLKVELLEMY